MAATTLPTPARAEARAKRPGVLTVYVWELEKLTAQLRVRIAAAACLAGPFAFGAALKVQDTVPADTLLGRWVHFTGFAVPLVVLTFVAQWALPLMIALVAGDIFATEDHHGTWKTLLTRSCGRSRLFWGKVLAAATFTVVVVLLLALGSLAAGVLLIGHQPLVSLSGTLIPAGHATGLVLAAWATVLLPAFGFTALGVLFSVATRNGPAGIIGPAVVGLLMQLYSFVNGADVVRHALLTTPFFAWHGLLLQQRDYWPLERGAAVCAAYTAACLAAGWVLLRRRDFTEG